MKNSRPDAWWMRTAIVAALLAACVTPLLANPVDVAVLENTPERVVVQYAFGTAAMNGVSIAGDKYVVLSLGKEGLMKEAGAPALPNVCRSILIADAGRVSLKVVKADFRELTGVDIVPSKGIIPRTTDPADVPYTFGDAYAADAFYPGAVATLRTPYILRDCRGVVLVVNPFQYNPVTHTVRVYTDVVVEVVTRGTGGINELDRSTRSGQMDTSFRVIYEHQFLNFDYQQLGLRYDPLDEDGGMLIICHDPWVANVQPLASHKIAHGINTTVVPVSAIGNNATDIKNHIVNVYNSSDLAFVLLVGDAAQVATPAGDADPTYAKLAGSDDYPDIIVGRFSAETAAQVDTQVERTIEYETMPAPLQDWFWKGTGIASAQGSGQGDEGQADWEHMDEIRQWLLAFGYTEVDQIYDTNGGTAQMVTDALNEGRGIVNYCGHGSTTSWSTTGFSNTDVNALVNDSMLPFIVSVACYNGDFNGNTCFAEAWLRATDGGEPTGAIAVYASTISQSWAPPMEGQDEFNLLLVNEAYVSYGALCFAGSCSMMDVYGADGVDEFDHWTIFGDPSVRIAVTCTDAGTVTLDRNKYACDDTASILVVDCGLNLDDEVVDTVTINVSSDTSPAGVDVLLTELGPASGQFAGTLKLADNAPPQDALLVTEGDTVTATYEDADDGTGSPATVVATAVVDCTAPVISGVQVTDVEPRSAVVTFQADEPARGIVYYGTNCDDLSFTAAGSGYSTTPTVNLTGLQDNTPYYFAVEAEDEAGNAGYDDNGGNCYEFTTPEVPDFFTELFDGGNDLANLSLLFAPNGSVDYYGGCVVGTISELPTDPSGGTALSLSDDSYATISLSGGAQVWLYGVGYSTFYVGSNGYLTFGGSDTTYGESLESHFDLPRISGLFDDLNPSSGGTVSWQQLDNRVVVTYLNVAEYSTGVPNTFQIELFLDGTITISYLNVGITDGIAGLSEGEGLDPDFYMSDLSAMGSCGPRPPVANSQSVQTPVDAAVTITLIAGDDGLPDPPGELTYVLVSLPSYGDLFDSWCGPITEVPHEVCNGGNQVTYQPDPYYSGSDNFQFKANDGGEPPEGGDSNIAVVYIMVGGPELVYSFPLDNDPGWTLEGQWERDAPTGGGSHNGDPVYGHTGYKVYGYNIDGDYTDSMPEYFLTTTAIDCTDVTGVELRFWRWLGVESASYDHARVQVSNDGSSWVTLWEHTGVAVSDSSWSQDVYDVSAVADGQATVYVRWGMGPTDSSVTYPGWNVDDIEIWGVLPGPPWFGDMNCDGGVNAYDIDGFILAIGDPAAYGQAYPDCQLERGDCNDDGAVNAYDIDAFIELIGGG